MPVVSRHALVPYTNHEIFVLVDAIENYPEFLPWCWSTTVHSRNQDRVEATLEIRKSAFNNSFSTRNTLAAGESIKIELIDGPFEYLNGEWLFRPLGDAGSKVQFDVDYQFSNPLVDMLLSSSFAGIVGSLVDAFVERAVAVYGPR